MIKEFLGMLWLIIRKRVLLCYVLILVIVFFQPLKFIPDYFGLETLIGKKDMLFRLLSMLVGFSGMLLTVFIVVYNFYVKSTRRNTLEFVTDNKWFRLIISCFFGTVIFLSIGFLLVDSHHGNDISLLYISFIISILFLLSLFPFAILALGESTTLKRIDYMIGKITENDIKDLYEKSFEMQSKSERHVEKNPVMLLRDISVNAVAEKDWVLPQTVLDKLFGKLIKSLNKESKSSDVIMHFNAWMAICNPLKREIVKQEDEVCGKRLLHFNTGVHLYFAGQQRIDLRGNPVDDLLRDYIRSILVKNLFFEFQSKIPVMIIGMIKSHFLALKYTDDELPTWSYYYEQSRNDVNAKVSMNWSENELKSHWHYLVRELPELIFDPMVHCIEQNRFHVFELFVMNLHSLLDVLVNASNLTKHQKVEAVKELLMKGRRVSELAISTGINESVDMIGDVYIPGWFDKDTQLGYEGLYTYSSMIRKLHAKKTLSSMYVDKFFMIARDISRRNLDPAVVFEIMKTILTTALHILEDDTTPPQERKDFLYQLQWLDKDCLKKQESLKTVYEAYKEAIDKHLIGYDGKNEYFTGII